MDPDDVISLAPDLPELAQLLQQLSQPRWADSACTFVRQVGYVDRISTTVDDSFGGECGILDFGEPKGAMGALYRIYFKQVLPRVGTMISGVRGPYAYLPASVERFPPPEEMLARMKRAGFVEATWTPYTFGIAGLYRGKK